MDGIDFDKLLEMLRNELFGKGTVVSTKIAIGKVRLDKKGWVRLNYTGLDGKALIFNSEPSISVVITGTSGKVQVPSISIPKVTVDLPEISKIQARKITAKLNKITAPHISIPKISKIPHVSIPTLTAPTVPKFKHIELPTITNEYYFEYKGKRYGPFYKLQSMYQKSCDVIIPDKLKGALGDWGLMNWARDAIIRGITVTNKALLGLIGWIEDWRKGNEIKAYAQEAIDSVEKEVNKIVDGINDALDSIASGIVNNANSTITDIENEINDKIDDINNTLHNLRNQIEQVVNGSIDSIVYQYNTKVVSAWNSQIDNINAVIGSIVKQINEMIKSTEDAIEGGVNLSLDQIREKTQEAINLSIKELWRLIGLAEGVVFQPAVIRNVGTSGFEIYSTGKGTVAYYIAVGE